MNNQNNVNSDFIEPSITSRFSYNILAVSHIASKVSKKQVHNEKMSLDQEQKREVKLITLYFVQHSPFLFETGELLTQPSILD